MGMGFEWISSVLWNILRAVLSMWGFGWLSSLEIGCGEEESKESRIYFTYWHFFLKALTVTNLLCVEMNFLLFWGLLTTTRLLLAHVEVFTFPRMIQEWPLPKLHGDQLQLSFGQSILLECLVHRATTKLGLQSLTLTG